MEREDDDASAVERRFAKMVVEDAPTGVLERVVAAFKSQPRSIIETINATLVEGLGNTPGLVGVRGVDTAAGQHLLYRAGPHDLALSVYEDDGWAVLGQLLIDAEVGMPGVVEVEVAGHCRATAVDFESGEFRFDGLPSGSARLVFIGPDADVIVDSIDLGRET